jgi:hypothetical protein
MVLHVVFYGSSEFVIFNGFDRHPGIEKRLH